MKEQISKSDKALIAIYELDRAKKPEQRVTVEEVAIKLWKLFPSEFSMRGHREYPNSDIQKYITKLITNNYIKGGIYNYIITEKGEERARILLKIKDEEKPADYPNQLKRYISTEINRIIRSNVFKYFSNTENPKLVNSDIFDFLGTTARSLKTTEKNGKSTFEARYNLINNEVIPACRSLINTDSNARLILKIWELLQPQIKKLIEEVRK
jgi:hypothetical protein